MRVCSSFLCGIVGIQSVKYGKKAGCLDVKHFVQNKSSLFESVLMVSDQGLSRSVVGGGVYK